MNDFKITKETDDYIIMTRQCAYFAGGTYTQRSKNKKFLCVGGPFNLQRKAAPQLGEDEYIPFNSGQNKYHAKRLGFEKHTQVWVHISLLT